MNTSGVLTEFFKFEDCKAGELWEASMLYEKKQLETYLIGVSDCIVERLAFSLQKMHITIDGKKLSNSSQMLPAIHFDIREYTLNSYKKKYNFRSAASLILDLEYMHKLLEASESYK